MIKKGASGAQAQLEFRLVVSGSPVTGHTWAIGELKLCLPGGSVANADVGNIVEIGQGVYALQLTSVETATEGKVYYYINTGLIANSQDTFLSEAIIDVPTAVGIRDAILSYAHDTGVTLRGLFRRLEALVSGKATGLTGVVARYFLKNGEDVAIEATQDPRSGTRAAADVSDSEA